MKTLIILLSLLFVYSISAKDIKSYTLGDFSKLSDTKQKELRGTLSKDDLLNFLYGGTKLKDQGKSESEMNKLTWGDVINIGKKLTKKEKDVIDNNFQNIFKTDANKEIDSKQNNQISKAPNEKKIKLKVDAEFKTFWKELKMIIL